MTTTAILATGVIPATREAYNLLQLGPEYLGPVSALQTRVLAVMQNDESHYLVPKSRAQFWHYLHGHGATVYSLLLEAQHAAQLVVRTRIDKHEDSRNREAVTLPPDYLLVQGALTHPGLRGRHLLQLMLDFISTTNPAATKLARVVPDNIASWRAFLKAGYTIAAAEHDPDDERRVFYLVNNGTHITTEVHTADRHDFAACQRLCRDGWRGTSYNKDTGFIDFMR